MARPRVPLISVEAVVTAAIDLLESEGQQGFSLRALGARLNVHSASIYHHFANKDDILMAAVRRVLRAIELPEAMPEWKAFVCESSVRYRRLLVAKPFLIPIMLGGVRPRTQVYAITEAMLDAAGFPHAWRPEILHTLDNIVVASAVVSVNAPVLNEGRPGTCLDHEALLRATVRQTIDEMERQAGHRPDTGTIATASR